METCLYLMKTDVVKSGYIFVTVVYLIQRGTRKCIENFPVNEKNKFVPKTLRDCVESEKPKIG